MNFKYFIGCLNLEEAKKVYKTKAKELHPDVSGKSDEEFKQLNSEYQYVTKHLPFPIKVNKTYQRPQQTYKKPNVKYSYTDTKIQSDLDKKAKILEFYNLYRDDKIKQGAVWLMFKSWCLENIYMIKEQDLQQIANLLKYQSGWVYYKKKECVDEKIFSV
jgi:hypothetical protein